MTFAFREALFALELIEREVLTAGRGAAGGSEPSRLRETLDAAMRRDTTHWHAYFRGGEDELAFARAFSLSDRCRYYWPQPDVQGALGRLLGNLSRRSIPLALLSQYLPVQYEAVRAGRYWLRSARGRWRRESPSSSLASAPWTSGWGQ